VSSCAPCDAFFFKDKKVIVVGGGDSAMEEALTLTKFATSVAIVHRREEFRASKIMVDRAEKNKKISFILNSEVVDVLGQDRVEGVKIKNINDNLQKEMPIDGIFVAIGHIPVTNIYRGEVELDDKGYVRRKAQIYVGETDSPGNYKMMTSIKGVFVAGDVHDYHYRQAVTAAAYGCMAAMDAEKWLESN
jgi:thioredoxin reductase (NADPH)